MRILLAVGLCFFGAGVLLVMRPARLSVLNTTLQVRVWDQYAVIGVDRETPHVAWLILILDDAISIDTYAAKILSVPGCNAFFVVINYKVISMMGTALLISVYLIGRTRGSEQGGNQKCQDGSVEKLSD